MTKENENFDLKAIQEQVSIAENATAEALKKAKVDLVKASEKGSIKEMLQAVDAVQKDLRESKKVTRGAQDILGALKTLKAASRNAASKKAAS